MLSKFSVKITGQRQIGMKVHFKQEVEATDIKDSITAVESEFHKRFPQEKVKVLRVRSKQL